MEKETIIWAITQEQLQEIAQEVLSRKLTDEEMENLEEEIREEDNLLEMHSILKELIKNLKS